MHKQIVILMWKTWYVCAKVVNTFFMSLMCKNIMIDLCTTLVHKSIVILMSKHIKYLCTTLVRNIYHEFVWNTPSYMNQLIVHKPVIICYGKFITDLCANHGCMIELCTILWCIESCMHRGWAHKSITILRLEAQALMHQGLTQTSIMILRKARCITL